MTSGLGQQGGKLLACTNREQCTGFTADRGKTPKSEDMILIKGAIYILASGGRRAPEMGEVGWRTAETKQTAWPKK